MILSVNAMSERSLLRNERMIPLRNEQTAVPLADDERTSDEAGHRVSCRSVDPSIPIVGSNAMKAMLSAVDDRS